MPEEITVKNFRRSKKFGWGWSCIPTGQDTDIEIPAAPDYTGTLRQLEKDQQDDAVFQNLGGAFYNTAWFFQGKRITHTWVFSPTEDSITIDEEGTHWRDVPYEYRWREGFHPLDDLDDEKDLKIKTV